MNKRQQSKIPASAFANPQEQKRERGEDFVSTYANNVSISLSAWDIVLNFGRIQNKGGKEVIAEQVEVVMSKEIGKVLTGLLVTHFQAYESTAGEIVIPDMVKLQEKYAQMEAEAKAALQRENATEATEDE